MNSSLSASFVMKLLSHALAATLLYLALAHGLLPGLLSLCASYLLTARVHTVLGTERRYAKVLAASLVIGLPLVGLITTLAHAKGLTLGLVGQYKDLLQSLAQTAVHLKQKLPPDFAGSLPQGADAIGAWFATHLKAQAGQLAHAGETGLNGTLLAYVGLVIGALIAIRPVNPSVGPLALELRARARHFIDAFQQIVAAQFWIAAFNTCMTGLFLGVALPLAGVSLPHVPALLALTFCAGMLPIVGNLLCNAVLALVGVSVSPVVGLACLVFLILIHKTEYFINARVVGSRTATAAWELLAVMFAGEAIFGVPGLVAAPLYYAYLKKELTLHGLI